MVRSYKEISAERLTEAREAAFDDYAVFCAAEDLPVRLNIGCGRDCKDGWFNVDTIDFDGISSQWNLTDRWFAPDGSVDEILASHVVEHFTSPRRCWIMNEAYRVLKPGGKMTVIVPSWASARSYGDPTHEWPPVSEWWFNYLNKEWRENQAPHTMDLLDCNFQATWGYGMHPAIVTRNQEYQQYALNWFKEAAQDIHATLVKLP